jgi:hypothetical protein
MELSFEYGGHQSEFWSFHTRDKPQDQFDAMSAT